jgi:hypothetical protein
MSKPKIKFKTKDVRKLQRQKHARLSQKPLAHVTVVQDEITKEVLAVLIDRNVYNKLDASKLDLTHATLIDVHLQT